MPTLVDTDTRPEARYVQAFARLEGHTLNGSNATLHGLRRDAIDRFAALGFPTRKDEAWKYTRIEKVLRQDFAVRAPADAALDAAALDGLGLPGLDAAVAVLAGGRFREDLSTLDGLPEGVVVTSFAHAAEAHADLVNAHFGRYADFEHDAFAALSTAFAHDGLFVYVPKGVVVERPIQVIDLVPAHDEATLWQPRYLVVAEGGAQLRLVRTRTVRGETAAFVNAAMEVFVGERAHVDCYEIQDDGAHVTTVNGVWAYQERDSVFRTSTYTFGDGLVRNNATLVPDAEGCEAHLYGLFLADGTAHVDNHTLVDHAKPNCFSNELYKGILADRATGVFNGKVLVRQDAQQTNAYQSNKSIVLDETARMFSKPELEIYADDVKCSHGATTGQLDRDAIFYLRSRGLTEARARALLLAAFARDVLASVRLDALREHLDARVTARFN